MKWILLIFLMIPVLSPAQRVSISILKESVEIKNDSIYFNYQLINRRKQAIAFYNASIAEIGYAAISDSLCKTREPSLLIDIFNQDRTLPYSIRMRVGQKLPEDSLYFRGCCPYQVVGTGDSLKIHIATDLWPRKLSKGIYYLQLRYYSNSFFDKQFNQEKLTKSNLKDCSVFKGIIRSNVILFTYP